MSDVKCSLWKLRFRKGGDLTTAAAITGRKLTFTGITLGWVGLGIVRGTHSPCGICGGTKNVRHRGWTDEGEPMATCSACGGPDE